MRCCRRPKSRSAIFASFTTIGIPIELQQVHRPEFDADERPVAQTGRVKQLDERESRERGVVAARHRARRVKHRTHSTNNRETYLVPP